MCYYKPGAVFNQKYPLGFRDTGLDLGVSLSSDNVLSLFLVIEQGKVLKVLHTIEEAFIISQYSLFHNEGPVLSMAIDSKKVL